MMTREKIYHKFDKTAELLLLCSFQQPGCSGIPLEGLLAFQNVFSFACAHLSMVNEFNDHMTNARTK